MRIDGERIVEPGTQVDPERQQVTVRGRALPPAAPLVYRMLHKPENVLTTLSDPAGRPTIRTYLPKRGPRLYPVGRLDGDTSGLLLLTNDGWLTHRLMHPRYEVPKTYHLTLAAPPPEEALESLASGVEFGPGEVSRPARVEVVRRMGEVTVVALTICEGKNRQVRRMCAALDLPLLRLQRVRVGDVELGDLPVGETRALRRDEVAALRRAVEGTPSPAPPETSA